VDSPIYRLLGIDVGKHQLGGSLGVTRFAHYALTADLLEGELRTHRQLTIGFTQRSNHDTVSI
jgi:hypothetical protein